MSSIAMYGVRLGDFRVKKGALALLEQVDELVRQLASPAESVVEVGDLFLCGQAAFQQQPSGLFKCAFASQCFDGDTTVLESGPLAVNEAYGRFGRRHVCQPWAIFQFTHGGVLAHG